MRSKTESTLLDIMRRDKIPGMSFASCLGGKLSRCLTLGVIEAGLDNPTDITPVTFFEAASLSKGFFAYLVLRLVEEGHFDLETHLNEVLPFHDFLKEEGFEFIGEDYSDAITIGHILTHRTGLPGSGWQPELHQPLTFLFKPGEEYEYCGLAFGYLQKCIEKKTGKTLEDLAQKEFKVLKMEHSTYHRPKQAPIAVRHDEQGKATPIPEDRINKQKPHAAYTLHTTANDYALFLQALMRKTELHYAFEPTIFMVNDKVARDQGVPMNDLEKVSWCLGWARQGDVILHWGDNGPTKALAAFNPKTGMAMVYFANSDNAFRSAEEIVSLVFKDTDLKPFFNFLCGKYNYERHNKPDWTPKHLDFHQHEIDEYRTRIEEVKSHTQGSSL